MKKSIQVLLSLLILLGFSKSADAVMAYPYPVEITQPDGTKITVIMKGDEHVKWAQTIDGYSLMRNSKGVFEYAMLDSKNDMVPSGIKARNINDRSFADKSFLDKVGKGVFYSKSQIRMLKSISKSIQKSSLKSFPTTGTRKLICILMNFTDVTFTSAQALTNFQNLFNQTGYNSTGSVNDYYKENSYNQLNLITTVVGPYNAKHNMAWYGANDASGYDVKPDSLVTEAVLNANPYVNYADFDNDGNGYVDGIYVIYAGYGEEAGASADAIWAHAYYIPTLYLDGKYISSYSCSPELEGNSGTSMTQIGVICHEFGHVMGAYDFYDTDWDGTAGTAYEGTGDWDIMAGGSWNNNGTTPAHHNPFTKAYVYNWATVNTITSTSAITLNNAEQYNNSFYRINTTTANEYFLIENRQKQMFDSYIPGHGMLIYHVDGNYIDAHINTNDINAFNHQGFYPVCASASTNPGSTISSYGNISSAGCPYPGLYARTSFTDNTIPNSHSWAGANTSAPITGITENTIAKTVSFNVTITTDVVSTVTDKGFLGQNYPNPFDQSTKIDFRIEKPSNVVLTIFNNLGQVVDVLVNENLPAGSYSKEWSPNGIPSGIYFYQLNVNGDKQTKRLVKK